MRQEGLAAESRIWCEAMYGSLFHHSISTREETTDNMDRLDRILFGPSNPLVQTIEPSNQRSNNSPNQRSTEPTIYRTNEPPNQRSTEPTIYRTNDPPNQRSTGPTIYRTNDLSDQRSIEPTIHRSNDPLN